MLEVSSAREVRGTCALPPNPDLFMLATLVAMTSEHATTISPVPDSPLVDRWKALLDPHLSFQQEGNLCIVRPRPADASAPISLQFEALPHPEFASFLLLGLGKSLSLASLSTARLERWKRMLRAAHCEAEAVQEAGATLLRLAAADRCSFALPQDDIPADDLHAYVGLALGLRAKLSCEQDQPFLSPVRHLLAAYGRDIQVKSTSPDRLNDPIARRIQRMKKKKADAASVTYVVSADFSVPPAAEVRVTLPGDDVLAAALMAAKALVQKGNLVIENVPLEVWCTQMLQFLRRMGCAPAVQETGSCTFGAVGMVQLQRFELGSRKVECRPFHHFARHLPSMLMVSAFAEGETVFRGLEDLRLDTPDGVARCQACLDKLEVRHGEMPDAIVLKGSKNNDGFDMEEELPAHLGAALAAAGLRCQGRTTIADQAIASRWPGFKEMLDRLCEYKGQR